ncbi:MAG: tRNA (adenine-N1)-methyltransferase [Chloroflexota bacterium]|nr:tRNA (adenine-N1)-methyltransferase [Chloroflexota bacterium]
MTWKNYDTVARDGDYVQLLGRRHKSQFLRLKAGEVFQTHRGELQHDNIIGKPWGARLVSHTGSPFFLMRPGLADLITEIKRNTQIMYPKDIGYLVMVMGIGPGVQVLEAGTGSGALTTAFAFLVGDSGKVISYEKREQMQNLARNNLRRLELLDRVELKLGDVADGFEEREMDAVFLDVPNPYDYIPQVKASLKLGGYFGTILPTTNQVSKVLAALRASDFAFVEVCEVLLRFYKPDFERLRPTDRMVAHTGYLVFARSVMEKPDED